MNALCRVMEVSRSGYYTYLKRPLESNKKRLLIEVKAFDQLSRGSYGSRQMSKNLKAKGYAVVSQLHLSGEKICKRNSTGRD